MEKHRQLHPLQGFPLLRLGQVDHCHAAAAPGTGPRLLVGQMVQQSPVFRCLRPDQVGPVLLVAAAGGIQPHSSKPRQIPLPPEEQVVREKVVHPDQVLLGDGGPAVQDLPLSLCVLHMSHPPQKKSERSSSMSVWRGSTAPGSNWILMEKLTLAPSK